MRKYSVAVFGVVLLLLASNTCFTQEYSIGIESGIQWHSPDFYLNYKAVSNQGLEAAYEDGTINNRVEMYNYSPLWSLVPNFTYTARNPRKRNVLTSYGAGIGYAEAGFVIIDPVRVWHEERGPIMAGVPRENFYKFGYLSVPLKLKRVFQGSGKVGFFAMGINVTNYILLWRGAHEEYYNEFPDNPVSDVRLSAARDYWMSLSLEPELGVVLKSGLLLSLKANIGLTPLNLLKYDETLYEYQSLQNAGAYEKTEPVNFFYGGALSIGYRIN